MDTKQLTKYAGRFFSGTLLSRITGLGREMMMAAAFGATPLVAAFWMAFRFSHLLRRILGEGALNCAFVPHFKSIHSRSPKEASRFFFDLSTTIGLCVLGLVVLGECALGWMLMREVSESSAHVIRLTMQLLPSTLFITLFALNQSYLNCLGRFFLPSFAPALMNLTWIGGVYLLWALPHEEALSYLTHFVVLAFMMQWFLTLPATLQDFYQKEIFHVPSKGLLELRRLMKPFLLALLGVTAVQINTALDTVFARIADPSGPAYLWYAIRLQQLPLALFGISIATTLFPTLTQAVQENITGQIKEILRFGITRTLALMVPVTVGVVFTAKLLVRMVYAYGAFDAIALSQTSAALVAYSFALIPMTLVLVFGSTFYARGNYKFPAFLSLSMVGLNLSLNALFIYGFGWGAISVAYATTLCSYVNALILGAQVYLEYGHKKILSPQER
jgi:putative peptidoglycan lipid II flippase